MSPENYIRSFRSAIARIYQGNAVVGAGFLISDRQLLTCAHVVTVALGLPQNTQEIPSGAIELDFPLVAAGQRKRAIVKFWQPVNPSQLGEDIAGLELEDTSHEAVQPVRLLKTSDYWGHPFRIFGFPKGHDEGVWASGVLRDQRANGWIQIEDIKAAGYQVEPGFSGALVWDESLQGVVGMAVAAEKRRENVKAAFMIPTSVLSSAWSDVEQRISSQQPSVKDSTDTLPSFRQVKLNALKKNYSVLCAKYEAAYNQLNYMLSQADAISIREQIKALDSEISQVEQQMNQLSN
ncbi:serine protease [Kovacikia minuta CCNUW1]|uniref:trypsin-like peptidase domain-containing protein n=1 Tax=Kovacikia minuta TaxID=2931930 RepID=UPI001CCEA1CA|nr:trypsin-like peptidase domain-containing protein [Kovacikia minuta]UBF27484.1 serine protease [Kovacikia minuta CCNUW1]